MRQAFADFDTSLNRVRALVNNIINDTSAALANPAVLALHETQQCGSIVLLTGYFEAFLKDLVRKFIEKLSSIKISFGSLPESIRNCHFEGGGRILTEASEAARKGRTTAFGNATREDIVARLHSTSSTSGSYQILWEAFADTKANPRPDVVKDIAKNLGMSDFWRTVSSKSNTPARWSDTALTTMLTDLILKRNECAHTGKISPVPTTSQILDFIDMLTALGEGFVRALEDLLRTYVSSTPTSQISTGAGPATPAQSAHIP